MKTSRMLACIALAASAAACESIYERDITAPVSGPTTVAVGASVILTARLDYSNGVSETVGPSTAGSVVWSSSNTAVATVDVFGVVTGVAKGTATITATPSPLLTDGKRTPGTLEITVQ